jgi:hypothetical protein
MPSPFPGMDPYIERAAIFPDFHDRLLIYLGAALRPLLRPKYVPLTQDRLYVVESDRPIFPDVAILRSKTPRAFPGLATALAEADAPAVFDLWLEEIRQPFITIIEPAADNQVVTAIEVLSPDNKRRGAGRKSYQQKREEFWAAGANLIEIDLLREGKTTVRVPPVKLDQLRPWHYLVTVTRQSPARQEVYAIPLQRSLPRIAVPLGTEDKDVVLDLQAVFARCWEDGPYPELLLHEGPPPGTLTTEELSWCDSLLQAAGYRPVPGTQPPTP